MLENEDLRNLGEKYANEEPILFALIENGQVPDWTTENFPEFCLWLPESIFDEIQELAQQRNCKILESIDKYAQTTVHHNKLVDLMLEFGTIGTLTDNPDIKIVISKLQKLAFEINEKDTNQLLIEGP